MDFLEVGKIINTHGLRGEVKIMTWTDYPEDFEKLEYVVAVQKGKETHLDVQNVKYQKNNIIVKFKQLTVIEEAELLKNAVLKVPREALGELPEGVYYIADLLGCEVSDEAGVIGELVDVFSTGSNDVYDIRRQGKRNLLVPIIDGVLLNVDIENKKILIKVPEGLEE